jgi:hypothetical protein
MQRAAAEINLSETAFVTPIDKVWPLLSYCHSKSRSDAPLNSPSIKPVVLFPGT